jgi:acetylornithine deacetylase/succinyl-diaminopimelate desuccinylase-like protein
MKSMPVSLSSYVEANRSRFLEELFALLRIPSISTAPEHKPDVARAAEWVAGSLRSAGLENVAIIPTERHPLIYADWLHAPGKPTVLCYGHYDVQPPDPLEQWISPPFEPALRNGNIYARGAVDDKGQMHMQIKAVESLRAVHGTLPVNLKVLIEGEEEVGGLSVAAYVAANTTKLKADVALVSDTALYAPGMPTLCVGLRGLIYVEVEATGPSRDLHSGLYGGAAPNAVYGLAQLLAKAKDSEGRILIPGIYDDVAEPTPAELESWRRLPFREDEFLSREVGSSRLTGEPDRSILERVWSRPTLEVHGIGGGFTGAGSKTVIPAQAVAKVSFRLVPNQDPQRVIALLERWVAAETPPGVQAKVRVLGASPAIVVDPAHPAIRVAAQVFSEGLGQPTVFIRSGGSVPIVGDFARHLGIPTVMMGFGLPDDALHSPNEKFCLENYYTGIKTIANFLARYGSGA